MRLLLRNINLIEAVGSCLKALAGIKKEMLSDEGPKKSKIKSMHQGLEP